MKDFLKKTNKKLHSLSRLKFPKEGVYFIPAVLLLLVFVGILSYRIYLGKEISQNRIVQSPISDIKVSLYPQISSVLGVQSNQVGVEEAASVSAQAYYVVDKASQVPLMAKNKDFRFSMASTTKIMTALVALDHFKNDDVLLVKRDDVEGAKAGLQIGQQFKFIDLLYAMLLPSANDAAVAIADNYPGGQTAFVEKMNEKARSYNLFQTHFADPAGLDDDGGYTTPVDLARLASISLDNSVLKEIVGTKKVIITSIGGTKFALENLNKLLGYDNIDGIKTGYTEQAGEVLVTSKTWDNHVIVTVVMKSDDRFGDTQKILGTLSPSLTYLTY